jgi:hypothetical protein
MLILEFDGVTEADYQTVSTALGIDLDTGKGDWPPGLITHITGIDGNRGFVIESWTSREAQAEFMQNRLGPAMSEGGLTVTPKVTWATVVGEYHPGA